MRTVAILAAIVVVLGAAAAGTWVAMSSDSTEPTKSDAPKIDPAMIAAGRQLTMQRGCVTCHSEDGTIIRGPSYKGLYGSRVSYTDGTSAIVDEAEVRDGLIHPAAKVIENFEPLMPPAKLSEDEIKHLIAYLRSIGAGK